MTEPSAAGAARPRPTGMRFAAIVPARNEVALLPDTVRALRDIDEIDVVVVVDDGSVDETARVAEREGAIVLRHPRTRGKAAALTTGVEHVLASERSQELDFRRALAFVDADLGSSASGLRDLLRPVVDGELDLAIAVYTARGATGGHGLVVSLARRAINERTGWQPEVPLSGVRALTVPAWEAVRPLARGWGVETAMTIDALRAGLRVGEVPTTLTHRATGSDLRSQVHRARQYVDVRRALARRPVRDQSGR